MGELSCISSWGHINMAADLENHVIVDIADWCVTQDCFHGMWYMEKLSSLRLSFVSYNMGVIIAFFCRVVLCRLHEIISVRVEQPKVHLSGC